MTSASNRANHIAWQVAVAVAIYSASQLDNATTFCLVDCQQIGLSPRKKIIPVVLFLLSTSPARSLSLKPFRTVSTPFFLA
uniref:Uncharacterized protein n=1 Tax=Arundo donax TaxID=35708 RepID=A0A0A9BHB1_ARUDO